MKKNQTPKTSTNKYLKILKKFKKTGKKPELLNKKEKKLNLMTQIAILFGLILNKYLIKRNLVIMRETSSSKSINIHY